MAEYFKKDGDEFVAVEDTLFTQDEIDKDILPKRLERERKKFANYDELKEKAGKVDTISQEFTDKLKEKDTKIGELEGGLKKAILETVKVKAIHEFKLSDELAEFIDGDDEATIRQKAEKLSKGVGGGGVKITKNSKPEGKASDTKKIAQGLFGNRKSDD